MMICTNCGTSNPLGRVFCGACGKKLDLSGISSSTVTARERPNFFLRHWGKLFTILIVILLGAGSLAFFPNPEPIGKRGSSTDAARVQGPLRRLASLSRKRTLGAEFAERGINAYLHRKARSLRVESLSVDVGDGSFMVRMVEALQPVSLGSFKFTPRFSYDYIFVPAGPVVRARRAAVGRLVVIGPLKHAVVRKLHLLLASQAEWKAFEHAAEIKAEDGKIKVKAVRE